MSDKPEGSDTHPDSREEESEDTSKSRSLKSATHKLKAEALRRLQLGDADYDNEGAKNNEGREGSSHDENVVDTGNDGGVQQSEISPGKSDVLNKEKEDTLDVTDSRGADSIVDESRESGAFGKDSAKPNEDILGDSVVGENIKSHRQNEEGSDISAHVDGQKDLKVSDQSISKGSGSQSEGQNVNQGIPNMTANEGSTQGQLGGAMRDSRPGSASSRPGSGIARPGSGSEVTRKGEGSKQKPSSRPGSGAGNRSRPGSGSDKVCRGGGLEQQPSSGRTGSGSGIRSRPQSSGKRGTAGNDGGTVVHDESTRGSGVGEDTSKKDEASVGDRTKQTPQDLSQSKASKDDAEGATSSDNLIEGMSQIVGTGSAEHRQDHHGDKSNLAGSDSVDDSNAEKSSAEKLSSDNKSESKQTGGDDKISDDVSPPMNEQTESKDEGTDSKQSSDSLSNNKQDSEAAEAGNDSKEDKLSEERKGDIQTASSSDQQGPDDTKTSEQIDASETLHVHGKDGSKDSTSVEGEETSVAVKTADKDRLVTESTGEGKEQDGTAAKSGSDAAEGDKPEMQTGHGDGDLDSAEKSSDKQTAEQGRTDDASVDGTGEKKADDSEKKKKKKKAKKEGAEQEESMEEEDEEEADKSGTAGDDAQPVRAKQTESGMYM